MQISPTTLPSLVLQPHAYSVYHFVAETNRAYFDLEAPYQRESVWNRGQQQALVKSLLMGLPTGSVTVNRNSFRGPHPYTVIDGKQRIETLRAFVDDEYAVPARWFADDAIEETIPEYPEIGVLFSGLTAATRSWFTMLPLPGLEASVKTVQEQAEIYLLINAAGTDHTEDDLRKAANIRDGGTA